jgi:hypothetical protein
MIAMEDWHTLKLRCIDGTDIYSPDVVHETGRELRYFTQAVIPNSSTRSLYPALRSTPNIKNELT